MIQGITKKAGITQDTLSQMEKADNELRTATLEKLAGAMELNVEQLQD
jgi:transcriptional regulator with XRE-family HTH domain